MKIDFFPAIPQASLFPPEPARKCIPEWYKNASTVPPGHKEKPSAKEMQINPDIQASTIKRCMPVHDYITTGYVIKNFLDISLTQQTDEENNETVYPYHNTRLMRPFVEKHKKGQHPGVPIEKEVLKLSGVWGIKTPPGYSCFFYQPFYHALDCDYYFLPSIVDTDTYHNPVSLPFILKDIDKSSQKEIFIPCGKPMISVYPFKRDDWSMSIAQDDLTNDKSRVQILTQLYHVYTRFFHKKKTFK